MSEPISLKEQARNLKSLKQKLVRQGVIPLKSFRQLRLIEDQIQKKMKEKT